MASDKRSAFQQQYVEALIESKAINLEAVGETLSKFGERAILEGEVVVVLINQNVHWNCGWPGPVFGPGFEAPNVAGVSSQIGQ